MGNKFGRELANSSIGQLSMRTMPPAIQMLTRQALDAKKGSAAEFKEKSKLIKEVKQKRAMNALYKKKLRDFLDNYQSKKSMTGGQRKGQRKKRRKKVKGSKKW